MAETRLLLTGATGYIGGSVLSTLLASSNERVKKLQISALVRRQDQADKLSQLGVAPILFKDLNDSEAIRRAASEHDIVINTASGFHVGAAKALVEGLGDRKKKAGKEVSIIHTSGTSNLGDHVVSGGYTETRIFSDTDDIYGYEKQREAVEPYSQRATDLVVIESGRALGVQTYIIMSPTIYGTGSGLFNKLSMQIPHLIRTFIQEGRAAVIGDGQARWNHVHIADLAELYELFLVHILGGPTIPAGEKGIYFSETGEHSWLELSEGIARAGHALGVFPSAAPASISLEEAAPTWGNGSLQFTELGFASMSRTTADLCPSLLGWKPRKTRADFEANFREEFELILKERKQ